MRAILLIIGFLYLVPCFSQTDSAKVPTKKSSFALAQDSNYIFQKVQIDNPSDTAEHHLLTIGGYISTYYAYYDDENTKGEFVQFPTICPRNNQFNLNMAMLSFKYQSKHLRSNLILHYGDIPQSSWPAEFNLIQEANVGFRITEKLWLDAGFFKAHIGIESFQPRENITSSMAILSFYSPYYLSGAKLHYGVNSKLSFMVGAFNGFNEYIDNNKDKMLGFSAIYRPTQKIALTYNFLTCDESPDNFPVEKRRFYNNFHVTYISKRWLIGAEINYGLQHHSLLSDPSKQATMMSGLVVGKYNFHKKASIHVREEYFSDPDKILSGDNNIGNYIYGTTAGLEFHPINNINMSLESRLLRSDNLIFKQGSFLYESTVGIYCLYRSLVLKKELNTGPGPIGIFDSGYGGLTILKEISKQLPQYDYLYLGDNARAPYGTRSFETVYQYTLECVNHLFDKGCHLVILACNTASAKALRNIQQKDLPNIDPNRRVLGVIRPTTELAGMLTKTKHIGVLGTTGTVVSNSYPIEIHKFHPDVKVFQEACPMWVPLIENNEFNNEGSNYFIEKNVKALLQQSDKIDTIILGCTHYPLLENKLRQYIPQHIQLVSQGDIVAKGLLDYLKRHPEVESKCTKNGKLEFYTTEIPENFNSQAGKFLGKKLWQSI